MPNLQNLLKRRPVVVELDPEVQARVRARLASLRDPDGAEAEQERLARAELAATIEAPAAAGSAESRAEVDTPVVPAADHPIPLPPSRARRASTKRADRAPDDGWGDEHWDAERASAPVRVAPDEPPPPTDLSVMVPTVTAIPAPVETVEAAVEAAVEAPVEAAVEAPVEAAVEAPVEAAVEAPVEAAVEAPVEIVEAHSTRSSPSWRPSFARVAAGVPVTKRGRHMTGAVDAAVETPVEAAIESPVEIPVTPPPPPAARPAKAAAAKAPAGRGRSSRAIVSCPYCAEPLKSPPIVSGRCPRCRQRIVVRRVGDRSIYLTEAALPVFQTERRRAVHSGRWTRERDRWLEHAMAVGADPASVTRLTRLPLSEEVVAGARNLYMSIVERGARAARRARRWEDASRLRSDQALVLYRIARSVRPVPADILAVHRDGLASILRGIAEIAKSAELRAGTCCDACRADDGRTVRIANELRRPSLPHEACPKGLCRCRWSLADRDRTIVSDLLRRHHRQKPVRGA